MSENDFGFTTLDETEFLKNSPKTKEKFETQEQTIYNLQSSLETVEELILPLLDNFIKTADKEYIHWPNRKEIVEEVKGKLLKLTRELDIE